MIVTVVVKNATLQGHIWEHLKKCIAKNAVMLENTAIQTVKKKKVKNNVGFTENSKRFVLL